MNIETLKWDQKLCNFFDIDKNLLPEIRSSSEIYGNIAQGPLKGVPISGVSNFEVVGGIKSLAIYQEISGRKNGGQNVSLRAL